MLFSLQFHIPLKGYVYYTIMLNNSHCLYVNFTSSVKFLHTNFTSLCVCPTLHFTPICIFFTQFPFHRILLSLSVLCANGQASGTLSDHIRPLHWVGESRMEHSEPRMGKKCWGSESRMEHTEPKIRRESGWRQLEELLWELEDQCWTKQH